MTGDEYIALLVRRRRDWEIDNGPSPLGRPALLEWFIRPGDELIFTPPESEPEPRRVPADPYTVRLRRSIAWHEAELLRLAAKRDALPVDAPDPSLARLRPGPLRQHQRRTETAMRRRLAITAQIERHQHGLAWKRARLAKHEEVPV
jgi:hypothetical protein